MRVSGASTASAPLSAPPAPHVMLSTVMFVNGVRLDIELTMPDPRALFGLEPLPAVEPSSRTALAFQGSAAET